MAVNGYTIFDEDDDGVFAPGSSVFVTDIDAVNIGEMHLPHGAVLDVFAKKPAAHVPYNYFLPPIAANSNHIVRDRWRVMIPDAGAPGTKPYESSVHITSRISLLGRPFPQSLLACETLPIMYPVRITDMRSTQWLGPNEMSTIEIDVHNISRKVYGDTKLVKDGGDSLGTVQVRFIVDELINILPGQPLRNCMNMSCIDYVIENGHKVAICTLPAIPPHTKMTVGFSFTVVPEAGNKLFAQMPIRVDLLLQDRVIEYRPEDIRVTPVFIPNISTDVVLVTSSEMERKEFLAWSYLLQCLNLSVNFWDIERYDGMATPDLTWVGTCRTLIVPCPPLPAKNGQKTTLTPADFLRFSDVHTHLSTHFIGDAPYQSAVPQTGLLLIGNTKPARFLYDLLQPVLGNLSSLKTPVAFQKFGPHSLQQIPLNLPAPPNVTHRDFTVSPVVPRFALLPAPKLPEDIDKPEVPNAELKLSGCGSCCDWSGCGDCCEWTTSNSEILMRRFHKQLVEADPTRQYLIAHGHGDHVGKSLGETGCFSTETVPIAVYPALFPRATPVLTINTNPILTSDWVPFDFDGVVFRAKHEPWKDNVFSQIMRGIVHLLPVEKRMELLTNPFLNTITFNRSLDNAQCEFGFLVAMSLARSVNIEQKIDKEYLITSRIAKAVNPQLGERLKYAMLPFFGPHVEKGAVEDIAEVAAKNAGIKKSQAESLAESVVADIVARDDDELLKRFLQFTPWGNGMFLPCDDDNFTILEKKAPDGEFPFIVSNPLHIVEHQALSWVYSIADHQYRQNKLMAPMPPMSPPNAFAGAGPGDYYHGMTGYGEYSQVFTESGVIQVVQPDTSAPAPAPPQAYFTVADGTPFPTPPVYEDEARRAAYMAYQQEYEVMVQSAAVSAPQFDPSSLPATGAAQADPQYVFSDELKGSAPSFEAGAAAPRINDDDDDIPPNYDGATATETSAPGYNNGAPVGYQQGAPGYQQGAPGYQQGAPGYQQGAPGYQQGAPGYQQGAPGYQGAPYS